MQNLIVTAPAKINLSLDITGRRSDGYHELKTVMQSLSIADRVEVTVDENSDGITLTCDDPAIPTGETNTAYRAARLYLAAAAKTAAVDIKISKRIPVSAGLAGGSSDAAAVLLALNRMGSDRLPEAKLAALAAKIGADVPFCLHGGTVLCEGIGQRLTSLSPFSGIHVLLINPGFPVSTPWAFQAYDSQPAPPHPDTEAILTALARKDIASLSRCTANVLEAAVIGRHPKIAEIQKALALTAADMILMSGSGPTVYGLYRERQDRDMAAQKMKAKLPSSTRLLCGETSATGPIVEN